MRPPHPFDISGYQKRLDEITGLANSLYPIVRLVWGPDFVDHYPKESVPRWVVRYDEDGNGISPPRWFLVQRFEPEQYVGSWLQFVRNVWDGELIDRGEAPREGWYGFYRRCAWHDSVCCKQADRERRGCQGDYRPPPEKDLELLRRDFHESQKDSLVKPKEVFSQYDLECIDRIATQIVEEDERKRDEEMSLIVRDIREMYLTGRIYSTPRLTESGLIVPG